MKKILEIQNLYKSFDNIIIFDNSSFSVNKGSVTLLTGENGTGKTTLFNIITGLDKKFKGKIIFNKTFLTDLKPLIISRLGIVRLFQNSRIFSDLSVIDNLIVSIPKISESTWNDYIFRSKKTNSNHLLNKNKALDLLERIGLKKSQNERAGNLSYGQQKLVSFCMLVMNDAKLILLDEPFAGLNLNTINVFSKIILEMKSKGITFVIIEHNITKALEICDNHIKINDTKIHLKPIQ